MMAYTPPEQKKDDVRMEKHVDEGEKPVFKSFTPEPERKDDRQVRMSTHNRRPDQDIRRVSAPEPRMVGGEGSLPPRQTRELGGGSMMKRYSSGSGGQGWSMGGGSSSSMMRGGSSSSHMVGGPDSLPDFDLSRFGGTKRTAGGPSSAEEPDDIKNLKVTKGAIFKPVAHHTLNQQEKGCYNSRYEDVKGDANTHFQTKGAVEGRTATCARSLSDYEALFYL